MNRLIFTLIFLFGTALFLTAQTTPKGTNVAVFPNPATEYIALQTSNELVESFALFTILGEKVRTFKYAPGEKYSILDLPNGLYLVQIYGKNEVILSTKRLNKR